MSVTTSSPRTMTREDNSTICINEIMQATCFLFNPIEGPCCSGNLSEYMDQILPDVLVFPAVSRHLAARRGARPGRYRGCLEGSPAGWSGVRGALCTCI